MPRTTRRGFLRLAGTTAAFASLSQIRALPIAAAAPSAGGAVAAALLAEAGRSVVLLEKGPDSQSAEFTQREDQMLPRLFEEAGTRRRGRGPV
jgi:hypothetical protein